MEVLRHQGSSLLGAVCAALFMLVAATASAGFYRFEEIKPMWVKMDLNGDGYIDCAELNAFDPGMIHRFRSADFDRNGKLDLREFEGLLISL